MAINTIGTIPVVNQTYTYKITQGIDNYVPNIPAGFYTFKKGKTDVGDPYVVTINNNTAENLDNIYLNNTPIQIGGSRLAVQTNYGAEPVVLSPTNTAGLEAGLEYYAGLFVGSTTGTVYTSPDLVTWTNRASLSQIWCKEVLNDILFLGAGSSLFYTSTNSITYQSRTSPTAQVIRDFTYGLGIYVMGTDFGGIYTSTNITTWTSRVSGFGANGVYGLAFGNNTFLAGGQGGILMSSTDGITWSARSVGNTTAISNVKYLNSLFFVANGVSLYTSTDAITWTTRLTASGVSGVTYGNGVFVAQTNNIVYVSTDSITWATKGTIDTGNLSGGTVYALGRHNYVGRSGSNTTSAYINDITVNNLLALTVAGAAYGNGTYVVGYESQTFVYTSTDLINWTSRTSTAGQTGSNLYFANNLFMKYSPGNTGIGVSTDAITWTTRTTNTAVLRLLYANGYYVHSSLINTIYYSTDLITWTLSTVTAFSATARIPGIAYGNGLYVLAGDNSAYAGTAVIATSPDLVTWTNRTTPFAVSIPIQSLAYGNGKFVVLTAGSGAVSTDGITWTLTAGTGLGASTLNKLIFANTLFVASCTTTTTSSISTSFDGINWTLRSNSSRTIGTPMYGNGLYVTLGLYGAGSSFKGSFLDAKYIGFELQSTSFTTI